MHNTKIKKGETLSGLSSVLSVFQLPVKNYTTQEFLQALPINVSFKFTNNTENDEALYLTDAPEKYGTVEILRGFTGNYCTAIFYSADINSIWRYNYHAENSAANGWIKLVSNIDTQTGVISSIPCPAGEITEYNLTFPKPFLTAPKVLLSVASDSSSVKYANLLAFVRTITSTGCVIRIANNSDIQMSPGVEWIAMSL